MNWSSSEQIEYFSQIVWLFFFFSVPDWHRVQQAQLKALFPVPFFLPVWTWNNAVPTNTIQSFSPWTVYQPERLSKLTISLPLFSPAHLQTKKRDKGVSLTSRSLSASSCQEDLQQDFAAFGSSKWSTGKRAQNIIYHYMVWEEKKYRK